MKKWTILINGKWRKEVDKHLVVQAVLALSRQLDKQKVLRGKPASLKEKA